MREIYEKYYTVRLYARPDLHFSASIVNIPGEYDTEEEARAAAEPEYRRTCEYNKETGESYSWFEIQIMEHYKKIEHKMGKWRDTGSGQECGCCGEIQYGYDNGRRYCQWCGAKMEVSK